MREAIQRKKLDSAGEVQDWVERALDGELEPGVYHLDVSNVEQDMSYPESRKVPGFTAPHSRSDLQCVARVSNDDIRENRSELEQTLDELYQEEDFLGTGSYGVTSRRDGNWTLSRGCYFEE